jgi:hypothetical protein
MPLFFDYWIVRNCFIVHELLSYTRVEGWLDQPSDKIG